MSLFMLHYIISGTIIVFITLLYFILLKPIKTIRRLAKQFQNVGYKVYSFPYHPLKEPLFQTLLLDSESGNPYKTFSTKFTQYDIAISNSLTSIIVAALSPRARKQFIKHQIDFTLIKPEFIINLYTPILGRGLLFSEGNEWKRKRKIFSTFFTYQFLQSKIPQMIKIIQSCFDQNEGEIGKKNNLNLVENQYSFKLFDLTSRIFSNIILSLFLGTQSLQEEIEGQKVYKFMLKLVVDKALRNSTLEALILGPRYLNLGFTRVDRDINRRVRLYNDWANKYINKIIQGSSEEKKPENLLQLLYRSKSKDNEANYTKEQLIEELKIFFFAGTDTTAHFLEMMIYLSVQNKAVYSEVIQQMQNYGEALSYEGLKKLKYIECIQKQTTRHYGPIPLNFGRIASRDFLFNGVFIEKGTYMDFYSIGTHYNPEYYPQPLKFNPNRWKNEKQIDGAYLTGFGMGPRSCIGQTLAHLQSKLAYCCFMKRYSQIRVPEKINLKYKFMNEAQDLQITTKKKT